MNSVNRKIVLSLYKNKIKICQEHGYKLGNWDNSLVKNNDFINKKMIKRFYKNNLLGSFLMNNIRDRYKFFKYENDEIEIDSLIDYAFEFYRELTYLCNSYIRK